MRADRVAAVAGAIDRIALLGARVDDPKLRLIVEDLAASTYGLGASARRTTTNGGRGSIPSS